MTDAKTYFEMQQQKEQQLELDASQDGHAALALQAARMRKVPTYPMQPNNPWALDAPIEPPTGEAIDAVEDVSKVR